jgi:hypothetical protein
VRCGTPSGVPRLADALREREWRPDDEYEDMKGRYSIVLRDRPSPGQPNLEGFSDARRSAFVNE